MDKELIEGVRKDFADCLFYTIRENYNRVNHDYLQKQITIASEYLSEEQKAELRGKGFLI